MVIGPALQLILIAFLGCLIVRAVFSWIEPYPRNRIHRLAFDITEPVMRPVRRFIPPMGGLDLSFLVVFFIVSFLLNLVQRAR
jgi:YggT family protein